MIDKYKIPTVFFVLLLFFPSSMQSKDRLDGEKKFGNESLLFPLFEKMHRLDLRDQGKINIVHIGDSHIQADIFTNTIRQALQARFGNGGYGFSFPYRLAKTNGSSYVSYSSNIDWKNQRNIYPVTDVSVGLSGIGLYTDQQVFQLNLKSEPSYLFDRIKLLYPSKEPMFRLSEDLDSQHTLKSLPVAKAAPAQYITHKIKSGETLSLISRRYKMTVKELKQLNNLKSDHIRVGAVLRIKKSASSIEPKTLVDASVLDDLKFVDSASIKYYPYYSVYELSKLSTNVSLVPNTSNKSKRYNLNGIVLENDNPGIVYNAIGVNGAKASDYNKYPLFFDQLPALNPDLVIISLGTNEAFGKLSISTFKLQMEMLINNIKQKNPDAIILVMSPPPSLFRRRYENTFLDGYAKALASIDGCVYWDLLDKLGGSKAPLKKNFSQYMSKDKIHYTKEGYQMQGEIFVKDLMSSYNNYVNKDTIEDNIKLY